MIPAVLRSRSLLYAVCALCAICVMEAGAAAQMEFAGIAWGTPAQAAGERLQGMGYVPRGVDQNGDHVFLGPQGELLVARMAPDGLVQVQVEWTRDPARLPARYARMVDSLQSVLGAPYASQEHGTSWNHGEAWVNLWLRPAAPQLDSTLFLFHTSPADDAEALRRGEVLSAVGDRERQHGPADSTGAGAWAPAAHTDRWELLVDTVRFRARGDRVFHARLLDQWVDARRLENGLLYDAAVSVVQMDCRGHRLRVPLVTLLYRGVPVPAAAVSDTGRRSIHPRADTLRTGGLRQVCAILARQR
jgi:hypothetical protein